MYAAVAGNLLPLLFYKYSAFALRNVNAVFSTSIETGSLIIPLGISFITFSSISYLLDVYRDMSKPQKDPVSLGLYLSFFPKLIQGPIVRYEQFEEQLAARKINLDDIVVGSRRFIIGLAKKVLIADLLAVAANNVFGTPYDLIGMDLAWYGLICYAMQIYFDFSGYTDMAVGLGRIFGFRLPENFNYPYISKSITDFWRRWHMTLTGWFRIYVFIPLEFARKKVKFFRQQTNLILVFLLTGLWHGANWNFILWGVYFGIILALESGSFGRKLKKIPAFLQHAYALMLILLGWVFFRIEKASEWSSFLKALLGGNGLTGMENLRSLNILLYLPVLFLAILVSTNIPNLMVQKIKPRPVVNLLEKAILIALFILSISFTIANGYKAFLYQQF